MHVRYDRIIVYVARPSESGASHEFLQLRRIQKGAPMESWRTIAGAVKENEPAWKAAVRNLREVAGLAPLEFYRVDRVACYYSANEDTLWNCPQFCAVTRRDAPVVIGGKHDAIRWIDRKYAETLFFWPIERRTVAEICQEILDDGPARQGLQILLDAPKF